MRVVVCGRRHASEIYLLPVQAQDSIKDKRPTFLQWWSNFECRLNDRNALRRKVWRNIALQKSPQSLGDYRIRGNEVKHRNRYFVDTLHWCTFHDGTVKESTIARRSPSALFQLLAPQLATIKYNSSSTMHADIKLCGETSS